MSATLQSATQSATPFKSSKNAVNSRQIAFFGAFVLPIYKLVETPSLLARFAKGDLLFPALFHFLLQTALLIGLMYILSTSEKTLFERLEERLGKWINLVYGFLVFYFLFSVILPLLDLEKFVYAVFYDTSPTLFSFAAFFLFCGFACTKGIKTIARVADLSLFLFLIPFLALIVMSLTEADFTNLFPLFQSGKNVFSAFTRSTAHFSDVLLLLPLLGNLKYTKKDGKKITAGYVAGGALTLLFLAVFYGVYSTIAGREHYAFSKIAQYFPVLAVVGRIDLILVYLLCTVLFFFVATPLQYISIFTAKCFRTEKQTLISALLCALAFVFVLFCNKYYNFFYGLIAGKLYPVFWLCADLLPLSLFLLCMKRKEQKPSVEKNKEQL